MGHTPHSSGPLRNLVTQADPQAEKALLPGAPWGGLRATPDLTPRLLSRPLSYPRSALCLTLTPHFLSLY